MPELIATLGDHVEHMEYASLSEAGLPLGSGVVESTVRRVINQRFKSASKAWGEAQLEALLYLRALLKSGRWDAAVCSWLRGEHWLVPVVEPAKHQEFPRKMVA